MKHEKIIVGLDIGTTKTSAVVGRKNKHGSLDVLGLGVTGSEGVHHGIVSNIDKAVFSIEKAVKMAGDQSNEDICIVNAGIVGQHIRSSTHHNSVTRSGDDEIRVEEVNKLAAEMYKTVIPAGNEIIHVMPLDYSVDYECGVKDPVGMSGVRLEGDFHVITAKSNDVKNLNKCITRSGLKIENLILEPLSSSLSVLSEQEMEAGVCLVDIGGGTTDVAIFHENIIRHTAIVPFGGNIITSDIKEGCLILRQQAEQLKVKFGRVLAEQISPNEVVSVPGINQRAGKEISLKNLAYIIEARMEEIIEMVHTEIITSGLSKKLAAGLVITGGGSLLTNVRQLFEYMTGMATRVGRPNIHLGKSIVDAVKSPMYATSVGLVLSGYKDLDMRETRYREQQGIRDTYRRENGFLQSILNRTRNLINDGTF